MILLGREFRYFGSCNLQRGTIFWILNRLLMFSVYIGSVNFV